MNTKDRQRLEHIHTHCKNVYYLMERCGREYGAFVAHPAYVRAMRQEVSGIGEMANLLSDSFRISTADRIPWGMTRCLLLLRYVTDYYEDDNDMLWETARWLTDVLLFFCHDALEEGNPPHSEKAAKALSVIDDDPHS